MKKLKKGSRGSYFAVLRRMDRGVEGSGELITVVLFLIFGCSLFVLHSSLLYAESLSDVKLMALQSQVKERWGRDPFVRFDAKASKDKEVGYDQTVDLKIDGIISDGKKALAIINGGFYRKNDRVNDFLIEDIGKDKVLLVRSGKKFYLGVERFAIEKSKEVVKK